MFGNGVMGQNVKRSLTFALFGSKMTLIKIRRVIHHQFVRITPGIPEMNILRDISLVIQVMKSPIYMQRLTFVKLFVTPNQFLAPDLKTKFIL